MTNHQQPNRTEGKTIADLFQSVPFKRASAVVWLAMLGALVANIQPMFLGAIAEVYGFNGSQLGFIGGAELGGGCLASICALYWFPRVDLGKVITLALVVSVLGNLLTPVATNYYSFLLVRFCTALFGTGVLYAIILGVIGQMNNPERLIASAIILQVASVAAFMILIPVLVASGGMTPVTLCVAALMATGLYVKRYLVIPTDESPDKPIIGSLRTLIWGLPGLALLGIVVFDTGISSIWAFAERLGSGAGFSMSDSGMALAIGSVVGVTGAIFSAYLGLRRGRYMPVIWSILGLLIACYMFTKIENWFSYMIAIGLLNFFWNFALPYLLGSVATFDKTGRLMVLIPAAQSAGFAVGPILSGLFIVGTDYSVSVLIAAGSFLLCAAIVVPILLRMEKKQVGQK